MRIRRRASALALLLVLIIVLFITRYQWMSRLGRELVNAQEPFRADAIVVLGGDFRGTRILKGAELAWAGYAPVVLVSGSGDIYGKHESDLAVDWALAHGYAPSLFAKIKYPAVSTRDEAHAVVAELRRRRVRRFDLVTSNFHTARAARIFYEEAPELEFRPIASPDRYFDPDRWWSNREGEKTFAIEWMKTVAEWLGM